MGDNRDHSADSRFPAVEGQGISYVPVENLVGRAMVMVFSTDGVCRMGEALDMVHGSTLGPDRRRLLSDSVAWLKDAPGSLPERPGTVRTRPHPWQPGQGQL